MPPVPVDRGAVGLLDEAIALWQSADVVAAQTVGDVLPELPSVAWTAALASAANATAAAPTSSARRAAAPATATAPAAGPATAAASTTKPTPPDANDGLGHLPATLLDYWTLGTYVFEGLEARVLHATADAVYLDRTVFHAQGGGQPSDTGVLADRAGLAQFRVDKATKDARGLVRHTGHWLRGRATDWVPAATEDTTASPGPVAVVVVVGLVDEAGRRLHARLHSAGHVLDAAMRRAGYAQLTPTKGYHFPQGAYVEYELDAATQQAWSDAMRQDMQQALQQACDELVGEALPVRADIVSRERLAQALLGDSSNDTNDSSKGKGDDDALPEQLRAGTAPVRVVTVGREAGCACGGTHVSNTRELGRVVVRRLQKKGQSVRVKYDVE